MNHKSQAVAHINITHLTSESYQPSRDIIVKYPDLEVIKLMFKVVQLHNTKVQHCSSAQPRGTSNHFKIRHYRGPTRQHHLPTQCQGLTRSYRQQARMGAGLRIPRRLLLPRIAPLFALQHLPRLHRNQMAVSQGQGRCAAAPCRLGTQPGDLLLAHRA